MIGTSVTSTSFGKDEAKTDGKNLPPACNALLGKSRKYNNSCVTRWLDYLLKSCPSVTMRICPIA